MKWIDDLSQAGTPQTVSAGDELYYEGLPGGDLYLVIQGSVGLYMDLGPVSARSGGPVKIATVVAGEFFGAEGFFDKNVLLCTAKAESPSRLLRLDRQKALRLVESSPEAMIQLVAAMTQCLRGLKGTLTSVISTQKDELQATQTQLAVLSEVKSVMPSEPPAPLRPAPPPEVVALVKAKTPPKPAPKPDPKAAAKPVAKPEVKAQPKPDDKAPAKDDPAAKNDGQASGGTAEKAVSFDQIAGILPPGHPRYDTVAKDSDSKFLSSKSFTCSCCQKDFSDYNILSFKLKTKEVRDDMRTINEDFESLWYSVRVCPKCNAAGLAPIFSKFTGREAKYLRISNYAEKVPKFSGFSKPRTLNEVLESYYLALHCLKHIDNDPLNRAQLWRRLMWLYDDIGDESLQMVALDNTLEAYQEAYQKKRLNASESFHLSIVLGDLFTRKGDRTKAYKFFYEALHGEDKSNQVLIRHAQDMMTELRHGGDGK